MRKSEKLTVYFWSYRYLGSLIHLFPRAAFIRVVFQRYYPTVHFLPQIPHRPIYYTALRAPVAFSMKLSGLSISLLLEASIK